ncbi:MAG: class I SAM-dependent methyltransferase [Deltaproteobacteria bacterium]|nr:class I SAM-dependent methyltransferase [Deltaproteobacteria bacterium]
MTSSPTSTQAYYDQFSQTYERERHHGYHRMLDELEGQLIERYGRDRDVFEAGCGTGLLLREASRVAKSTTGLDLSRGMLSTATQRGLNVVQGSVTAVPLPDACMDLVYSMKVLAHVPPIKEALAELARLVRPGGHLLLEFYNPYSLRYLTKKYGGPQTINQSTTDHDVFTRYDTVEQAASYLPANVELVGTRGVRIFTPTSSVFKLAPLGKLFSWAEHKACDLPLLRNLGGFVILIARKKA